MQSLIEDVIRWFGYYALRLVTWGRYSGGREGDRLAEGAIGVWHPHSYDLRGLHPGASLIPLAHKTRPTRTQLSPDLLWSAEPWSGR